MDTSATPDHAAELAAEREYLLMLTNEAITRVRGAARVQTATAAVHAELGSAMARLVTVRLAVLALPRGSATS